MRHGWLMWFLMPAGLLLATVRADDPSVAERGRKALLGKSYAPPTMTRRAYDEVWKQWGVKEKPAPADYNRAFRQRYGLHEAPYPNGGLPMGMRPASLPLG